MDNFFMDNFRLFLESMDPSSVVHVAQQARQEAGVIKCARFGDCNDVAGLTVSLLKRRGVKSRLTGGYFLANPGHYGSDDYEAEHSWVVVGNNILDPTIDQFFSELDEDMETTVPGIYYSHPAWDGDKYVQRYGKYPQNF